VTRLIECLKQDPTVLRDPDIQDQLRALGTGRLDRYLLTQQLERAGLSAPGALWHILDTSEHTVTPRLTFAQAKELADDEGDDRLVEALLVRRGFSILGADAKAGKSTLAKNLMAAVLKGQPWLGRQVMQGAVLYYLLEEAMSEVVADLESLGVEEHDPIHFRRGHIAVEHFTPTLKADIDATGAILAVIDPLVDILGGGKRERLPISESGLEGSRARGPGHRLSHHGDSPQQQVRQLPRCEEFSGVCGHGSRH
jgi:hypothetical protein